MAFARNDFFKGLDIKNKPATAPAFADLKKVYIRSGLPHYFENGTFGFYVIEKIPNAEDVQIQVIWKKTEAVNSGAHLADFLPPDLDDEMFTFLINTRHIGKFFAGDFRNIEVIAPSDGEDLTILVIERDFRVYE